MAEFKLTATSALGGVRRDFEGVVIEEVTGRSLVLVAPRAGDDGAFTAAIETAFGLELPGPGQSTLNQAQSHRCLWMQPGQFALLFGHAGDDAAHAVTGRIGTAAHVTDQSDSFAMLSLTGPSALPALERICPIDLHLGSYSLGAVARTVMEHLSVIILRDGPDDFLLMSPRSSAAAFLHMVETSAENTSLLRA